MTREEKEKALLVRRILSGMAMYNYTFKNGNFVDDVLKMSNHGMTDEEFRNAIMREYWKDNPDRAKFFA